MLILSFSYMFHIAAMDRGRSTTILLFLAIAMASSFLIKEILLWPIRKEV